MALFQEFSWLDCIHDFWFQPTSIIDKCQHFDYCNVAETLALMIIDVKNLDLNKKIRSMAISLYNLEEIWAQKIVPES